MTWRRFDELLSTVIYGENVQRVKCGFVNMTWSRFDKLPVLSSVLYGQNVQRGKCKFANVTSCGFLEKKLSGRNGDQGDQMIF
jgi:hypothetical protein